MDKPFVRVVWVDASDPHTNFSWFNDEELGTFQNEVVRFESFGYMVSKTKLYVTLIADKQLGDVESLSGRPTKIPVGMVESITTIELPPIPPTVGVSKPDEGGSD